jgi:signal transduction histidine kinase
LEETNNTTNNAGSGANIIESARQTGMAEEIRLHDRDVIERSNRIAEQANQLAERSNRLIERSNQIAEVSNQLLERYSHYVEQPQRPPEKSDELLERLNGHFEKSNQLAAESKKPTERLGEILGTMNKVLVGIQHAIVRVSSFAFWSSRASLSYTYGRIMREIHSLRWIV